MLDPAFRRRGLVRMGISSLAEKCESLGIEVLCVDVRAGTPAEMIWRHLGFRVIGTHPDYARIRGETFEGVYMTQRYRPDGFDRLLRISTSTAQRVVQQVAQEEGLQPAA